MSFDDCKNWPSYCVPYQCYPVGEGPLRYLGSSYGECFSTLETDGPYTYKQNINTDYKINLAGVDIPIVRTIRSWETYDFQRYAVPTGISGVYLINDGTYWCFDGWTTNQRSYRATEDCTITRSTIHYLDLRYNVCLYRKNIEKIKFNATSSWYNTFKGPWGYVYPGRVILYGGGKKNWDNNCTEEWHLVVDGVDRTISTAHYEPIAEMKAFASDGSDTLFDSNYPNIADKDVDLIIHPSPPSSSDVHAWDDEVRYHGYYSYKGGVNGQNWIPDGGCGDYFYPAWCRALQEDPFWKAAAARRYDIVLNQDYEDSTTYTPAIGVTVDPLPRGTFVRHPIVGDVWQFLVGKRDGNYHLETSPNVNALILDSLSKNGVTPLNGTMLYYPIGV